MYMYRELPKKDDPASENVEAEPVKQTLSSGWQAARFLVWWKVQQGLVSFLAPDTLQLGKCLKVRSLGAQEGLLMSPAGPCPNSVRFEGHGCSRTLASRPCFAAESAFPPSAVIACRR